MSNNQLPDENEIEGGRIVAIGDRGLWVPDGIDGHEVWAGAQALLSQHPMYEFNLYTAAGVAITVIDAANASRRERIA